MTDKEKWYQFCMLCEHSYIRADDADMIYCDVPKHACPYKNEIEEAERMNCDRDEPTKRL